MVLTAARYRFSLLVHSKCLGRSFGGAVGDTTGCLEIGVPRNVHGRLYNAAVTSEGDLLVGALSEAMQSRFTAVAARVLVSGSGAMADEQDSKIRTGGKQVPMALGLIVELA